MRRAFALVVLLAAAPWACGTDLSNSSTPDGDAGTDGSSSPEADTKDDGGCGASCDGAPPPAPATKISTETFDFGEKARMTTIPGTTDLAIAADSATAGGPCVLRMSRTTAGAATRTGADGQCRLVVALADGSLVWSRVGASDQITGSAAGFTDVDAGGSVVGLGVTTIPTRLYFAVSTGGGSPSCKPYWTSTSGGSRNDAGTGYPTSCHDLAAGIETVVIANGDGTLGFANPQPKVVPLTGRAAAVAVDPDDGVFYISSKPSIAPIPEGPALAPAGTGADRLAVYLPDVMWLEPDGVHAVGKLGGPPRLVAKDTDVRAFTADEDAIYYVAHGSVWRVARK